ELTFLDDRAAELGPALEQLAGVVTDAELRGALQAVRAIVAAHQGDSATEGRWLAAAAESDPNSLATRLAVLRHAAAHSQGRGDGDGGGGALLDLACHVEGD